MRKINTTDFNVARRTTSRDINRRIALNLIRSHEPISRADLARKMNIGRGVVTILINELIKENLIFEGATGKALRGRKPTFLFVKTDDRLVVAVDIRYSCTYLMLTNFAGKQIVLETFETNLDPARLVDELSERIRRMLDYHKATSRCEGIGVVVPGNVDHQTGCIIRAPTLGWQEVSIIEKLAAKTGLPVQMDNAPKACALAQTWLSRNEATSVQNFVYVSVSDGVGVGIIINGELLRGRDSMAGEFGHIPLVEGGTLCSCGKRGCWETYTSNLATIARYFDEDLNEIRTKPPGKNNNLQTLQLTMTDLIARARAEDAKALAAIKETGRYLGCGLAIIINTLNPERIYLGGEITGAWDLIADIVRDELKNRVIVESAARTPIQIATTIEYPRLRGAAALIVAPTFAALEIA